MSSALVVSISDFSRRGVADKKNIWAKSADPDERKKAYKRHEKSVNEREMRTKNVVNQSVWDKMTGKDGKFEKKR